MFYLRLCKSPKIDITLALACCCCCHTRIVADFANSPQSNLSDLHVLETNCYSGAPFTLIDVGLFYKYPVQQCNIHSFDLELENNHCSNVFMVEYFKTWGYNFRTI